MEQTFAQSAPEQEVVVAIIDSGIDFEHEDLQGKIWENPDEIPGNMRDDDNNGYIDDLHGWNFLGNTNGENIINETLEVTRLYARYRERFENVNPEKLSRRDKEKYASFLEYKAVVERQREHAQGAYDELSMTETLVLEALTAFDKKYPRQTVDEKFMKSFEPGDDTQLQIAHQILIQALQFGLEFGEIAELQEDVRESFAEAKSEHVIDLEYTYNPDFDSRKIIGDDYGNSRQRHYGNNNAAGEFAFHGTHVGAIVAARGDNDLGNKGVFEHVKLMSLRVVPNGDEHDKDVANAIFYAVDNGASVINMSFGKGQTWDKGIVDKAVKYARKHDVLLVHAAGNSSLDNDIHKHYPIADYDHHCLFGKKRADHWLDVGAVTWTQGENAIAAFSHYGKKSVDLFAPGDYMLSAAPGNDYRIASGTSAAAPIVTGVAAMLRAYFPALTAQQVRQAIMRSVTPLDGKLVKPGTEELVDASELCVAGGTINAYEAFRLAGQMKGKKKVKGKQQPLSERA